MYKSKAVAARRFALLLARNGPCDARHMRTAFRFCSDLGQGHNALAFKRCHIIVERVPREIETNGCMFLFKTLHRQPIFDRHEAGFGQIFARLPKKRNLIGSALLKNCTRICG